MVPDAHDTAAHSDGQQEALASVPGLGSARDAAADQPAAAELAIPAAADPPQSQRASQAQSLQAPAGLSAKASSSGPVVTDRLGVSTAGTLGQQREQTAAADTASQSQAAPAAAGFGGAEGSRAEQQLALVGSGQAAAADAEGTEGGQVEQQPATAGASHAASVASSRAGEGTELAQAGPAAHSAAEPTAERQQATSAPSSAAAALQWPANADPAPPGNEAGTLSGPSAGESGVNGTAGLDGSASGIPQSSTSTAVGQAPQQAAPVAKRGRATQELAPPAAAPAQQQQHQSASPRGREGRVAQEMAVQAPAPAQALQQQQLPTPRRTADVGSAAPRRMSEVRPSSCPSCGIYSKQMPQGGCSNVTHAGQLTRVQLWVRASALLLGLPSPAAELLYIPGLLSKCTLRLQGLLSASGRCLCVDCYLGSTVLI